MGWWEVPDNAGMVVGDAGLDNARRLLKDVRDRFQEDLSRKPSLQELEYAMNLIFRSEADERLFSGVEGLEVKSVAVKAAKRPRRQKVTPGDIFYVRLDNGRYGFGRIIADISLGAAAEIFDFFSDQPIFNPTMADKRLMGPILLESYALLEVRNIGDWRIIGHTPDYVPDPAFAKARFVYGSNPNTLMAVTIYEKLGPISVEEAKGLPRYCAYDDYLFQEMIGPYL